MTWSRGGPRIAASEGRAPCTAPLHLHPLPLRPPLHPQALWAERCHFTICQSNGESVPVKNTRSTLLLEAQDQKLHMAITAKPQRNHLLHWQIAALCYSIG